jgi:phage-related protein
VPLPAPPPKPVEWVGSALADLRACPADVQDLVGYALWLAQSGAHHPAAKPLKGTLRGLVEIVADADRRTYRAVYMVQLAGVVYVLHVFQKKATRGIATPRHQLALIQQRLQRAREHYAAHYAAEESQ